MEINFKIYYKATRMKTNLVLIYQRYGPVDTNLAKDNPKEKPETLFLFENCSDFSVLPLIQKSGAK